jgi:hypothetical protein
MTKATDFQGSQEGSLSSRRQAVRVVPATEEIPERILQHRPRPTPPTLNANDEPDLISPDARDNIVLESKTTVCRVEAIYENEFTAIFSTRNAGDQRVRFALTRVPPSDKPLLQEGAVFYWITSTEQDASGEVISTSHIRFRRRPRLSPEEAKELRKLAREAIIAGGGTPISEEGLDNLTERHSEGS